MRAGLVALIVGVLAMLGCAGAGADPSGPIPDSRTLTGSATYRERIALPPDALLTVTLEDVSRADAPAVTLAQTQTALNGQQVPIPFSLIYPASGVLPQAVYAVRARITQGDRLLFITTQHNGVDALNPAPIELMMTSVQPMDAPPTVPDASLTDTYWKLTELRDQPVAVSEGAREPHLVLNSPDGRLSGSGGVNRMMGGYTVAGNTLTFSQVATTMMAGPPEAMQQEQAILAALATVRSFGITGNDLTLLDEAGTPVLKAVAVALR